MRHSQLQKYFSLINLLIVSSEKVIVQPSTTFNPISAWMTWPQSTNRIELTFQCSTYKYKISLRTSSGGSLGYFSSRSSGKQLRLHCKEGGRADWYGGNLRTFSTKRWGICRSGILTETLIIERTSVLMKIMRAGIEVFSRNWAKKDGRCLLEAGFWRLENYGKTVVSAGSVLGIFSKSNRVRNYRGRV